MASASPLALFIVSFCELAFPIQATLGIGGNLLNLVVLLSKHMKSRTNTLLACAAISDVLFLLCLSPHYLARHKNWVYQECEESQTPVLIGNTSRCYTSFFEFHLEYKHTFTFLTNWFSASSSWMMVVVSMDRFLAIKSPLSSRKRLCQQRKYAIVPLILLFSASFTSYNIFAIKIVKSNDTGGLVKQVLAVEPEVMTFFVICGIFGQIFIPLILLSLLNFFLIYYLRHRRQFLDAAASSTSTTERSRRSTKSSTDESPPLLESPPPSASALVEPRHITARISTSWNRELQRCERRVTVMVTAIVSSYVVSHFPSAIIYAYIYLHPNSLYAQQNSYPLAALSNFFVISGKVANFFLFCTSSKHFRMRLKETFMHYLRSKKDFTTRESQQFPSRSIPLNRVVDSNHNHSPIS